MSQLILSPTSTSIYATLSGLAASSTVARIIQFFKNDAVLPSTEIIVPIDDVDPQYSYSFTGLTTNESYVIKVRVIEFEEEDILEEYEEKAICGGESTIPSFSISDISSNSAKIELYRGKPSYGYYRLYLYDTVANEALYTEWLKPDSYPKQLTGLSEGTLYKVNVGYGDIYRGGVTWIGTQTFTTLTEFDTGHSDTGAFTMMNSELPRNVLGSAASSIKSSTFKNTYTRVTVTTKDTESSSEIAYSVGTDDGLELEVSCPWIGANEYEAIKIATYILSTVNTYKYCPYTASEALIDPAAELGDFISFDTITSELINYDANYESLFNADISAPTSNETEHEFPQGATTKDSTKRYVDGLRAALEVEMDKITAMVENNEGRFQKLQVTLDGVIIQNENGQTVINGSHIQTGTIVINQIDGLRNELDEIESSIPEAYTWGDVYSDLITYGGLTAKGGVTTMSNAFIYTPRLFAGSTPAMSDLPGVFDGITVDSTGMAFSHVTIDKQAYVDPVTHTSSYRAVVTDEANIVRVGVMDTGALGGAPLPYIRLGQGGVREYSAQQTYNVGDRVRYSSTVYECIVAITVPEVWTPAHWTYYGVVSNPPGMVKKYVNGLWIGEEPLDDTHTSFDPANFGNYVGLFVDFIKDKIVLHSGMYGSTLPDPNTSLNGQLFFKEV